MDFTRKRVSVQSPEKSLVSVKETRAATMKSGGITLTDHEGTTIIVYISRKSLALTHLPRKEEGMMTEATIHSHLCRRHVNTCFHKQAKLVN